MVSNSSFNIPAEDCFGQTAREVCPNQCLPAARHCDSNSQIVALLCPARRAECCGRAESTWAKQQLSDIWWLRFLPSGFIKRPPLDDTTSRLLPWNLNLQICYEEHWIEENDYCRLSKWVIECCIMISQFFLSWVFSGEN